MDHLIQALGSQREEHFYQILLGEKQEFLGEELIKVGTLAITLATFRPLFENVVHAGATAFALIHNHPSGYARPSNADISATRKIRSLSSPLGMPLFDHLIVGRSAVFSMRRAGLLS